MKEAEMGGGGNSGGLTILLYESGWPEVISSTGIYLPRGSGSVKLARGVIKERGLPTADGVDLVSNPKRRGARAALSGNEYQHTNRLQAKNTNTKVQCPQTKQIIGQIKKKPIKQRPHKEGSEGWLCTYRFHLGG